MAVVTDGRDDYLDQTLAVAAERLPEPSRRVLVDDTGHPDHTAMLADRYPQFEVHGREGRRGLAATVRYTWSLCDTDYVFHLEDDFLLVDPVDIDAMAHVLDTNPTVAQMCLLRQPWNAEEVAAGGIVEKDPADYHDRDGWIEHRRLFSLNPTLIPANVYELGWDDGNEAGFTAELLKLGYSFAYWGNRGDPPRCVHIGQRRTPSWSL